MTGLSQVSRSNLRQGAVYVMVGLVWGLVVPACPFPRLALVAHIQLTTNGVMYLVAGLVISHLPVAANGMASRILVAAPWLTWLVMLSEMANGWWGAGTCSRSPPLRRVRPVQQSGRRASSPPPISLVLSS